MKTDDWIRILKIKKEIKNALQPLSKGSLEDRSVFVYSLFSCTVEALALCHLDKKDLKRLFQDVIDDWDDTMDQVYELEKFLEVVKNGEVDTDF